MSWFVWLGLAALITALVAITGIQPKGARSVTHTHLMGMGRLALLILVIVLAYLALQARHAG
jgi:hypothetical protein